MEQLKKSTDSIELLFRYKPYHFGVFEFKENGTFIYTASDTIRIIRRRQKAAWKEAKKHLRRQKKLMSMDPFKKLNNLLLEPHKTYESGNGRWEMEANNVNYSIVLNLEFSDDERLSLDIACFGQNELSMGFSH